MKADGWKQVKDLNVDSDLVGIQIHSDSLIIENTSGVVVILDEQLLTKLMKDNAIQAAKKHLSDIKKDNILPITSQSKVLPILA